MIPCTHDLRILSECKEHHFTCVRERFHAESTKPPVDWSIAADSELFQDISKKAAREACEHLVRKRDQKIINCIGQYLGKESLTMQDLEALKHRLRHTVDIHTKNESYYIDDHLLVTFLPPEFTMEGTSMMVKQAYGPVGV